MGRSVNEVMTHDPQTVNAGDTLVEAARVMREHDVRRLPVVQDGRPVGILAIGDVAVERDSDSALADISAASPNN